MDTILFVDDDESTCELVARGLRPLGYRVATTTSPLDALDKVAERDFAVLVTDLGMAELHGAALCAQVHEIRPDLPVVVLTGQGSLETAVAALRAGAVDFVTKPVDVAVLGHAIARAAGERRLRRELVRLRQGGLDTPGALVGGSPAFRRLLEAVDGVSRRAAPILILGERGAGKGAVARAIFERGVPNGPFRPLAAGTTPAAALLEALDAPDGALLLRDIEQAPPALQRRLGERLAAGTAVRVFATSVADLASLAAEGEFDGPLLACLEGAVLDVPPLRARSADVLPLAADFLTRAATRVGRPVERLSEEAAARLLAYDFPGNVRELAAIIERAVVVARFDAITVEDLPERVVRHQPDRFLFAVDSPEDVVPVEELTRRYIRRVVEMVRGNKSRAATLLGLNRRTLHRKLERFDYEDTRRRGDR